MRQQNEIAPPYRALSHEPGSNACSPVFSRSLAQIRTTDGRQASNEEFSLSKIVI